METHYLLVDVDEVGLVAERYAFSKGGMTKLEILEMLAKELGYTLDHPAWH